MGPNLHQSPVVQTLDSAIHRIKIYLVDNALGFPNTYPLDSDLSGGQRYPTFEQPGPEVFLWEKSLRSPTVSEDCTPSWRPPKIRKFQHVIRSIRKTTLMGESSQVKSIFI